MCFYRRQFREGNLQILCTSCNARKGDEQPVLVVTAPLEEEVLNRLSALIYANEDRLRVDWRYPQTDIAIKCVACGFGLIYNFKEWFVEVPGRLGGAGGLGGQV